MTYNLTLTLIVGLGLVLSGYYMGLIDANKRGRLIMVSILSNEMRRLLLELIDMRLLNEKKVVAAISKKYNITLDFKKYRVELNAQKHKNNGDSK